MIKLVTILKISVINSRRQLIKSKVQLTLAHGCEPRGSTHTQMFFNTFSVGSPCPQVSHPQFRPEHVRQNTVTGSDTATKCFRALDKGDAHGIAGFTLPESNSVSPCWDSGSGLRRERLLSRMGQCGWLCKSCLNDGKAFWLRPEWDCWAEH